MNKLSVIIVTRNEEHNLRECLNTVKLADEIILVDQSSQDKTLELAKEFTDKIFVVEPKGYCEPDRITALEKASFNWVLCIDADERIPQNLAGEIRHIMSLDNIEYDGYLIPRRNYIFGRYMKYGGHRNDRHLRLFKKDRVKLSEKIHEPPIVTGRVGTLKNHMEHYSTNTLSEYCRKLNAYTDKEAGRMKEEGIKFSLSHITIKPVAKFIYQYIFQGGFMDGREGFLFYSLSAFYIFLKHVKLWERYQDR